MEDQTIYFSADPSNLGSLYHRSFCRQDNEIITILLVLDAGSRRSLYGCVIHPMEQDFEFIPKPPWNLISQVLHKIRQE